MKKIKRTLHGAGKGNYPERLLVSVEHLTAKSFLFIQNTSIMNYLIESGNEPQNLTDAQMQLLNFILDASEAAELVNGLKTVSEIAIYESERPIDTKEKSALTSVKILTDMISETLT